MIRVEMVRKIAYESNVEVVEDELCPQGADIGNLSKKITREDFMQLCELAAEFCDVCKTCTIAITKCDGDVITFNINDSIMTKTTTKSEGSGHQLRELH